MVSLSRMFLGSHSADQVIYGLFNSLAALVLYRYCLQYKIYQLYKSCLRGVRTGSIMLANTFVYILVLAAPIVVYEVNTSHRVFQQLYIDRLNAICGKNTNFLQLEADLGVAVTIISVSFGIVYGFIISHKIRQHFQRTIEGFKVNQLVYYLVGNWKYGNIFNIAMYVLLHGLFVGVLLGVFVLALPMATDNFYVKYWLSTLGFLLMGISLSCWIPLLLIRWRIIQIVHPEQFKYEEIRISPLSERNNGE